MSSKKHGWALKGPNGGFLQRHWEEHWLLDKTLIFRTKKDALNYTKYYPLLTRQNVTAVKVTLIVKDYCE
jgi:hypothetical protein